uniref:Uncharacterized protein n=1 Tax=Setaria digitata TaxID=48799 RepID=A0A915PYG0_9BILA
MDSARSAEKLEGGHEAEPEGSKSIAGCERMNDPSRSLQSVRLVISSWRFVTNCRSERISGEMALDDDQKNWNKENIPLDEDEVTCRQVLQNIEQEITRETTRQVFAELTIKNSDESDESDNNERQQNSDSLQLSFSFQHTGCFQRELVRSSVHRNERCIDNAFSEELEKTSSDEDCSSCEVISARSIQSKWKKLQGRRRSECSKNELYGQILQFENKEQMSIGDGNDNEKKNCEDMEEFITPPLCTIPGIELECELESCESRTLSGNKISLNLSLKSVIYPYNGATFVSC